MGILTSERLGNFQDAPTLPLVPVAGSKHLETGEVDAAFAQSILANPELAHTIWQTVFSKRGLRNRWETHYPNATEAVMFMHGFVRQVA